MSKALYRQFRPKTLDDVVGQDQVTKSLSNSLKQNKISHAYLFIGPRGTGKTSVARIFAHQVNGFQYEIEDSYVDIIEIDGASNRGIDSIRELREKVAIAPTAGKYKVYIIDEVHMLTKEAFNALLKTLEEPPKHVIFIMATTDAHKVPITITSRAQTYIFHLADEKTMCEYLTRVAGEAGIKITDGAIRQIAQRGGGSFRDSLSLLDQISALPVQEITERDVIAALGLPESDKVWDLIQACQEADFSVITEKYKSLLASGIQAEILADEMIRAIIEHPSHDMMGLLERLSDIKQPFAEARLLVALVGSSANVSVRSEPRQAPSARTEQFDQANANTNANAGSEPRQAPSARTEQFDWQQFLETVRGLNDAIYSQLKDANYTIEAKTLEIYPAKKIAKMILSRENNQRILARAASGFNIKICDVANNNTKSDALISKMSDIMGGEVQNDGGGNPFEE